MPLGQESRSFVFSFFLSQGSAGFSAVSFASLQFGVFRRPETKACEGLLTQSGVVTSVWRPSVGGQSTGGVGLRGGRGNTLPAFHHCTSKFTLQGGKKGGSAFSIEHAFLYLKGCVWMFLKDMPDIGRNNMV